MAKPTKELTMERDAIIELYCAFEDYYKRYTEQYESRDAYIISKLKEATIRSSQQEYIAKGFLICLRGIQEVQAELKKDLF